MILRWFLSKIYFSAVCIRRKLYQFGILKSYESQLPVISIGGIEFGGSGKTPIAIAVIESLQDVGFTPILLSRGYGRKTKNMMVVLGKNADIDFDLIGDEPLLINTRTSCPLVISKNRAKAAKFAEGMEYSRKVLVLDDGLQQMKLKIDCNIIVISGGRSIRARSLFPFKDPGGYAKTLRDSPNRIKEADMIMSKNAEIEDIRDFTDAKQLIFKYRAVKSYFDQRTYLLSAIANNEEFRKTVEKESNLKIVGHRAFKDHHIFSDSELLEIIEDAKSKAANMIMTTEKDYCRIPKRFDKIFNFQVYLIDALIENKYQFEKSLSDLLRQAIDRKEN